MTAAYIRRSANREHRSRRAGDSPNRDSDVGCNRAVGCRPNRGNRPGHATANRALAGLATASHCGRSRIDHSGHCDVGLCHHATGDRPDHDLCHDHDCGRRLGRPDVSDLHPILRDPGKDRAPGVSVASRAAAQAVGHRSIRRPDDRDRNSVAGAHRHRGGDDLDPVRLASQPAADRREPAQVRCPAGRAGGPSPPRPEYRQRRDHRDVRVAQAQVRPWERAPRNAAMVTAVSPLDRTPQWRPSRRQGSPPLDRDPPGPGPHQLLRSAMPRQKRLGSEFSSSFSMSKPQLRSQMYRPRRSKHEPHKLNLS